MLIHFSKMHGIGNDFIVIDLIRQKMPLVPELIRFLSNRHFGIGCDQLLVVEPPTQPDVDFRYRIFNADGGEVMQCGNGARCFAQFVRQQGLTQKSHLTVETGAGLIYLWCSDDGWVKVNMGLASFKPKQIPYTGHSKEQPLYPLVWNDQPYEFAVVNVGNPHAVFLVEDVLTAPVETLGAFVESHADFPQKVNVGFMQIIDRSNIRLRVYERGVGETIACGTGACAAAISAIRRDLVASSVNVELPGGKLYIEWAPEEPVWMIGPTAHVFDGTFNLEDFGHW